MTHIKICGLTNPTDAQLAVKAGASFLGFIVAAQSPRVASLQSAQQCVQTVGKRAQCVGVFQNASLHHIKAVLSQVSFQAIQLHGQESAEDCQNSPLPVIKALVGLTPQHILQQAQAYQTVSIQQLPYFLVDFPKNAPSKPLPLSHPDWQTLHTLDRPFFIAGGLTPNTVGTVIRNLKPYGVDVASGVERAPGEKDPQLLEQFCCAVP